jgi:hypothetical protein
VYKHEAGKADISISDHFHAFTQDFKLSAFASFELQASFKLQAPGPLHWVRNRGNILSAECLRALHCFSSISISFHGRVAKWHRV